jgi:hypothetical protein
MTNKTTLSCPIIIPPYAERQDSRPPLVEAAARKARVVVEYLKDHGVLVLMGALTAVALLTGVGFAHLHGAPIPAWVYLPVYVVAGTYLIAFFATALNVGMVTPVRDSIRRAKRQGDTSGLNDETYALVLSSLRQMGVPKARKVLHENQDNAQSYLLVREHAKDAAWKRGMHVKESKHYAHHLAMLVYPGASELERAIPLIQMLEDRGLVTDTDLITGILTTDVQPLSSGQL